MNGHNDRSSAESPTAEGAARLKLVEFFANNTIAANLLMVALIVGGYLSISNVISELFPAVDPGIVRITVAYPGATPFEIDESITSRIDQAVSNLDGVDRVVSKAAENRGSVSVELKDHVDPQEARDDIENAVSRIASFPPAGAEQPEIVVVEATNDVMTLVVTSDGSEMDLRRAAGRLEEALLALPSVGLVDLQGARDYEISIEVSETGLRKYALTLDHVANAIRRSSLNLSSGELRTEAGDLLLRVNRKRLEGAQFKDVVLRTLPDGSTLTLGEVARIRDEFREADLINEYNGKPSLFLRMSRSKGEDAFVIADEINAMLAAYQPEEGVRIEIWEDNTALLRDRVSLLVRNGMLGFALVLLFLLVMLDLKLAVWVAMGVPISFLGAFLFFDAMGVTINMVSMFALIVVLGIVVDDAIVVGENIGTTQESGFKDVKAAVEGVRGVVGPVSVGVITTMAAFAPLLFLSGTFGEILTQIPRVVIVVLVMSLIEVYFILPAHLSHSGKWSRWPLDAIQSRVAWLTGRLRDNIVLPICAYGIRHKLTTGLMAMAFLAIPVVLMISNIVRFEFFPYIEADTITAELEFPVGTAFETTREGAERIKDAVYIVNEHYGGNEYKAISVQIGGTYSGERGPGASASLDVASHTASVRLRLNPPPLRTQSAETLAREWRLTVGDIPGAKRQDFKATFFENANRLEFELIHPDQEISGRAAEILEARLKEFKGLSAVETSVSDGKRQYDVELTGAGKAVGLKEADIARQLRQAYFGEEVHRIQRGREELKVMVRYPRTDREQNSDLANTRIRLSDGSEVPLFTVANLTETRGAHSIDRIDGVRVHTVYADVDPESLTTTQAQSRVDLQILVPLLQQFPNLTVREAGFTQERNQDLSDLGSAMIVAVMLIFVLLASYLKSYLKTIVILTAIPFGAAGAIIGHWILGISVSFPSMFGVIALSGVVVNDSLVLINRFDRLRKAQPEISVAEATLTAVRLRFRAVLLTTVTTALGLTPMLFETNPQAQFLVPMAVSLAVGIVFASVVILLLVPVMLDTAQKMSNRLHALRTGF